MRVILRLTEEIYRRLADLLEERGIAEQELDVERVRVPECIERPYGVFSVLATAPWCYGYAVTSYGAVYTDKDLNCHGAFLGPAGHFGFFHGERSGVEVYVQLLKEVGVDYEDLPLLDYQCGKAPDQAWYKSTMLTEASVQQWYKDTITLDVPDI